MHRRTKIICTLSMATCQYPTLLKLIDAGMDVARLNMSHGTREEHSEMIAQVKQARRERDRPVAIMLDTKGAEVRVAPLQVPLSLTRGMRLRVTKEHVAGTEEGISLHPSHIVEELEVGTRVLFDDGRISCEVVEKDEEGLFLQVENEGLLQGGKGVNIPHVYLKIPLLTQEDKEDILSLGCQEGVSIIAASFIQSAEQILIIKELLSQHGSEDMLVLAKIENALGVKNFDTILRAADGIMVARGDLGTELSITQIPKLQKEMIHKCLYACKPVVTATQMLESMISNPRPTRAEVSDVANAIYDGTSAVMLSGETAVGRFPVETVKLMRDTILETEKGFSYFSFLHQEMWKQRFYHMAASVALAAISTAYSGNGRAIIALTTSGFTARMMACFRPEMPIIAITPSCNIYHQLSFIWGVIPIREKVRSVREGVEVATRCLLGRNLVRYGELVVITSGQLLSVRGMTNMMLMEHIGRVLVKGKGGMGEKVHGKISFMFDAESNVDVSRFDHRIVVASKCFPHFTETLKNISGLILQNHPDDLLSEQQACKLFVLYQIPVILRADAAFAVLKEGEMVTLDPDQALVFPGIFEG